MWCYRGGSISAEPRINDRIRVPEVRLVGPSGEQVGIVPLAKALELAQEYDLDLVEVAATARPPVCKLMDYGKFKYESAMKAREARKNQAHTVIKEMKLRPKIDPHDYDTKKGHVVRFLKQGDKVKITIMFRGREQSRPELGYRLLQRLASDVEDLGFIESNPKQDGRNMIMVLGPHKKKTEAMAEAREAQAARKAERQGVADARPHAAASERRRRRGRTPPRPRPRRPTRPLPTEAHGRGFRRGLIRHGQPVGRMPTDTSGRSVCRSASRTGGSATDEEITALCRRTRRTAVPASASRSPAPARCSVSAPASATCSSTSRPV